MKLSVDTPPIPANLLQQCPELTELTSGNAGAVLEKLAEVAQQYYECADLHRALSQAVDSRT